MTTALATVEEHQPLAIPTDLSAQAIEMAVGMGDFSRFNPADTVRYLHHVCLSLQLNPLTLPIRIIEMDGRKVMYATAECSAQLRARDKVSIKTIEEKIDHGCYIVRVKASLPDGRDLENVGVLSIVEPAEVSRWENGRKTWVKNPRAGQLLEGQAYANAVMKTHTKASRRATLALCGLGIPDESEIEEIKRADAPGQFIPPVETSRDRAAALNQVIDAEVTHEAPQTTEAPAPISTPQPEPQSSPQPAPAAPTAPNLPPSGELFSPASSEAKPNSSTGQTPAPRTSLGNKLSVAESGALSDELVSRLETIMASKGQDRIQDCVAYLNTKGLKPGQDIAYLSPQAANFITTHPEKFHLRVTEWIARGRI